MHRVALAVCSLLVVAAPAGAGTLQFWEDSLGAPGVTAEFPSGAGLVADIDFDADSAEGGGLLIGATEIEIRPQQGVTFVDFTCQLPGCSPNNDYVFVPGDEAGGGVVLVSDPRVQPVNGIHDLGRIEFDAAQPGAMPLVSCNYAGADGVERSCNPFVLVSLPEPGGLAGLASGALLALALRRRRSTS